MPRESRAIQKYGGSETEHGICSSDTAALRNGPAKLAWQFITDIKPEWIPGGGFSLWDSRARLAGDKDADHGYFTEEPWRKANILLRNGSRLYDDNAHPECSTPLCHPGGKEKLTYYKAADRIMQYLVEKHRENGFNAYLVKNNYGFDDSQQINHFENMSLEALLNCAVSYAHHDNHLLRRDVPWEYLIEHTIPWLILRQIFNGQGKVGSNNRRTNRLPWCDFQISQRADFFGTLYGPDTMGPERPIFNTRDVPYADRTLYRRLHMIPADHNMCETAYFLTIAFTEIHFMMIEDEFLDRRFVMADPIKTFWQISRDLTLQQPVSLVCRAARLPLDLLEEYVTLMGEYLVLYDIRNQEHHEAVALGLEIIKKLREDPEECFGELDWVTKKVILDAALERGRIPSFHSHEAVQIDLDYAKIGPDGIFFRPGIQKNHRRIISDTAIEAAMRIPPATRSTLQVAILQLFSGNVAQWNWSETEVWVPEENAVYDIHFENPLMTEAEYMPLIAGADRLEFLRRATAIGVAKKYERRHAQPARPQCSETPTKHQWRFWDHIYPEDV